jgi:RNA polymerase sigma-70 factor (ECF subfamily)
MSFVDVTRRSLLSAIKDPANRKAWDEFYKIYSGFIRGIAKGKNLMDDEVEDVTITVFAEISQGKLKYDPQKGKFRNLLATLVRRRALDQLRKRSPVEMNRAHRSESDTRSTGTVERQADPKTLHDDAIANREWEAAVHHLAVKEVKAKVSAKQFQVFDAYVRREWSVEDVTRTLGVTVNQVYTAKARVGKVYEAAAKAAKKYLDCPTLPVVQVIKE